LERLPSIDERQWLADALKGVIARRGGGLLDGAPLVEPANNWFPERWAATAAHGHRLAQRLMHYAGLDPFQVYLSAYEAPSKYEGEVPWDAGTAGWFAGFHDGRAVFGLHVRQFSDPEAAAGVLSHEVAHAWRAHHQLVVDDREEEEPLTDLTTVALGFGILTTNNTDRYRSSGTWSRTAWSMSSAGYLSPQAMSWLLALWCKARGIAGEARAIERHLEPNQRSYFRASMEELELSGASARALLGVGDPNPELSDEIDPADFVPHEPEAAELDEPVYPAAADPRTRNHGKTIYQKPRGDVRRDVFFAVLATFPAIWLLGVAIDNGAMLRASVTAAMVAMVAAVLAQYRANQWNCSACNTDLGLGPEVCPGCGGTVGPRVTLSALQHIREEEMDRRILESGYEDCEECEPETPCPAHSPTFAIGPDAESEEGAEEGDAEDSKPRPWLPKPKAAAPSGPLLGRKFWRGVAGLAAIVALLTLANAWWRQNHVAVYFDNPLETPVTVKVDGTSFAIPGHPPILRTLSPGSHHVVVTDASREVEQADVIVGRQPLWDALTRPRFYVYSVGARGLYHRIHVVYAADKKELGTTTSTLVGMQRWIAQDPVDFLFTPPPDRVNGPRAVTREAFEIADLNPRAEAGELFAQGDVAGAARALHEALAHDPCDAGTRQDLVGLFRERGEKEQAQAEATAWVSACGSALEAHRTYQNVLIENGRKEALLGTYQERVAKDPSAVNHYLYGRILRGQPAIAEFTEALRIDADVPWARIALGRQLLEAEQDAAAYKTLDDALRAPKVEGMAVHYFALAAVAVHKPEEALARLPDAAGVDAASLWEAKWLLTRAKNDWPAARILLAYQEVEDESAATKILRARLERDAGGTAEALAESLDGNAETSAAATRLRFEEAWETGRLRDAATMNLSQPVIVSNPTDKAVGSMEDIYSVEAAMLAHMDEAPARAVALRAKLATQPGLLAVLDAAEGRITKETVMARIADDALGVAPHAWFALAVHASLSGQDAAPLYRKSAERALDLEFPYRVALRMAERKKGQE
jgi:tetratricopeptide (TPR) repeat protein